jgi:hypothetical protein
LNANDLPTGGVTISGKAVQGQTLTASNSLADADGIPTSGAEAISYQWRADAKAISGATSSTFVLTQAEVGKLITVTASYTDSYKISESQTSGATAAVTNVNDAPTGSVTIGGTPTHGQTLTAANTLADALSILAIICAWWQVTPTAKELQRARKAKAFWRPQVLLYKPMFGSPTPCSAGWL